MAYGTTLEELVEMVRAETGASTSAAQGANTLPMLKQLIRRTQARLHADWDWPHMKIEPEEAILAGQRYYTFDPTLDFARIDWVRIDWTDTWLPVKYKADFLALYNARDSDADEREDPVQYWRHYHDGTTGNQYELWPLPADAQTLRFRGTKKLNVLVSDSDTAELDDDLIVLWVAQRRLKTLGDKSADTVLAEAQSHLQKLKGQGVKRAPAVMGGGIPGTMNQWPSGQWELRAARI